MSMSVILEMLSATRMPHVPMLLEVISVTVRMALQEMALIVQVMFLAIISPFMHTPNYSCHAA